MSDRLNAGMERAFRSVTKALDALPESEAADFLARLVLVLASELDDADRFERAVERARVAGSTRERA